MTGINYGGQCKIQCSSAGFLFSLPLSLALSLPPSLPPLSLTHTLTLALPSLFFSPTPGEGVTLDLSNGDMVTASQVVLTVPLAVLQRDTILFNPPLPRQKLRAISGIAMNSAAKICCRFRRSFWHDDINFLFCASGLWTEFWQQRRRTAKARRTNGRTCRHPLPSETSEEDFDVYFTGGVTGYCLDDDRDEDLCTPCSGPRSSRDGAVVYVRPDQIFDSDEVGKIEVDDDCVLVYGFATAAKSDQLAMLDARGVVNVTLQQLGEIFG